MADLFLKMSNVSKHYTGVTALDQVDFEIYQGEIHCLVGENGSGKSTLIKIISGTVQPDDGAHDRDRRAGPARLSTPSTPSTKASTSSTRTCRSSPT